MPVCVFLNCLSGSRKNKVLKQPTLHKFPKSEKLRHLWKLQAQSKSDLKPINFDTGLTGLKILHLLHYPAFRTKRIPHRFRYLKHNYYKKTKLCK